MTKQNAASLIFIFTGLVMLKFLSDIAFLLVISYLIASFLSQLTLKLEQKIGNKLLSSSIIFVLFWGIIITLLSKAIPYIYGQLEALIQQIPKYRLYLENILIPAVLERAKFIEPKIVTQISDFLESSSKQIFDFAFSLLSDLWGYTMATIHAISFIILVPLTNFYAIKELVTINSAGKKISAMLNPLLVNFLIDCSRTLSLYLKAQTNVCMVMCLYYSIALSIIGIDFAPIIGIFTGIAIAVPFVGVICSFLLASIITIFAFGISKKLAYVGLTYLIGQTIEGYFITPKIIGDKIGLSPIVIIIALICWGKLFGITGVLLAIPITCIAKVSMDHIIKLLTSPIDASAKL